VLPKKELPSTLFQDRSIFLSSCGFECLFRNHNIDLSQKEQRNGRMTALGKFGNWIAAPVSVSFPPFVIAAGEALRLTRPAAMGWLDRWSQAAAASVTAKSWCRDAARTLRARQQTSYAVLHTTPRVDGRQVQVRRIG
jgi:hypothetical protein